MAARAAFALVLRACLPLLATGLGGERCLAGAVGSEGDILAAVQAEAEVLATHLLQVDQRVRNATGSSLSGTNGLDWVVASAVPRTGDTHWWGPSAQVVSAEPKSAIVLVPQNASDDFLADNVNERVVIFARKLVAPTFATFAACVMVATWASSNRFVRFFPESGTLILVATIAGLVVRYSTSFDDNVDEYSFDFAIATALNLGLLPMILFNCGWQLDRAHFMSEFEHILNFAVIGTILSTALIASGSWLMGHYGFHHITSVRANVAFACLISSVDPVATMAAYCKLRIPEKQPLLYTMVFGEAAINDAVAITLFTVVNSNSSASIGEEIVICLFGSLLCGAALACLIVALMGYCCMHGRARLLTLAIFGSAWLIFAIAESMALSGIIANLFAGIVFRRFGGCLFTEHDEHGVTETLEFCGGLAESLVFMMVGIIASLLTSLDGLIFGLWATAICLAARGAVVPVCAAASNAGKRAAAYMEDRAPVNILTWRHQVMMWNGGLRGGVSLVLALELNKDWCAPAEKDPIVEGTYVVIVLLLVVCGGTTKRLLSCVGMAEAAQTEEYVAEEPPARQPEEQPRARLISTQSIRSEKELRERRPLITTARARWWGTAVVELFEPYVLGDRRAVEELVQAGARLEYPEPFTPRG